MLFLFGGIIFRILHWAGQHFLLYSGPILIIIGIGLILWDNKVQ